MGAQDLFQLDLFSHQHKDKPKIKIKTCNQLECTNEVILKFDEDEGIYIGNYTCDQCKRLHFWKYAK